MAKTKLLKAEIREHTGTNAVKKVRKEGRIPAIVYGHKQTPVAISLDAHNFVEVLHHGQRLLDVQIDKKKEKIIIKDLQYDYLSKGHPRRRHYRRTRRSSGDRMHGNRHP